MQETWKEIVINAVVYLAICTAVIVVGWNEPLSQRFMSEQEIFEKENSALVRPPPTPRLLPHPPSTFGGTALDRRPYPN